MRIASAHTHQPTPERNLEASPNATAAAPAKASGRPRGGYSRGGGPGRGREVVGRRTGISTREGQGESARGGRAWFCFCSSSRISSRQCGGQKLPVSAHANPCKGRVSFEQTHSRHPPLGRRACPRPSLVSSPEQIRGLLGAKISPRAPIGRRRMT